MCFQPTRHTPAQTATMVVRPTAMRTTPGTIRTTSQSDVQQLPQMSVQVNVLKTQYSPDLNNGHMNCINFSGLLLQQEVPIC